MEFCQEAAEVLVSGDAVHQNRNLERRFPGCAPWKPDGCSYECTYSMPPCCQMSSDGTIYSHVVENGDGLVVKFSCALDKALGVAGTTQKGKG